MKIKTCIINFLLIGVAFSSNGDQSNDLSPYFDLKKIHQTTINQNLAIQSGVNGNLDPGKFNRVFTNAENGISYYDGTLGNKPKWYSKAPLYGRYVFYMHSEIELDGMRTNIVSSGKTTFQIIEYVRIEKVGTGIGLHPVHKPAITLTTKQGYEVLKANGEFRAIGMQLKTNQPILGFEKYWRRL